MGEPVTDIERARGYPWIVRRVQCFLRGHQGPVEIDPTKFVGWVCGYCDARLPELRNMTDESVLAVANEGNSDGRCNFPA